MSSSISRSALKCVREFNEMLTNTIENKCSIQSFESYMLLNCAENAGNKKILDSEKNSILHIAVKKPSIRYNIFEIVANSGVDVDHKNNDGETVLDILLKKDKNDDIDKMIELLAKLSKTIDYNMFCKLMSKKYVNALCRVSENHNFIKNITKYINIILLFKKMVDFVFEIINTCTTLEHVQIYKKSFSVLQIITNELDFSKRILEKSTFMYTYEYIHEKMKTIAGKEIHENVYVLYIKFIGDMLSLKNSKFILTKNCTYTYYVILGAKTNDEVTAIDYTIAKAKILQVVNDNIDFTNTICTNGKKTSLMWGVDYNNLGYVANCMNYIMKNIDTINKREKNIINVTDEYGNNIMHYIFARTINYDIVKDFCNMISSDPKYRHLLYNVNINGLTPFNVSFYFAHNSFGKNIINMNDIAGSFSYTKKECVTHSIIMSQCHYRFGQTVTYEMVDNKVNKKTISYTSTPAKRTIYTESKDVLNNLHHNETIKEIKYVSDGFYRELKPYIYRNRENLNYWSKYETVVTEDKIQLLKEIYDVCPFSIGYADSDNKTCFMTSVMINSYGLVKLYIDIFDKYNIDMLKNVTRNDSNWNNIFHYIAFNNNTSIFEIICDKVKKTEDMLIRDKTILTSCFTHKNNIGMTPFDICIDERNFEVFDMMLKYFSKMDEQFAMNLIRKICTDPEYEQDIKIIKDIENVSNCETFSIQLYNSDNNYVCNLMHFCAQNKYLILLKHLLLSCIKKNKTELLHALNSYGDSLITISIKKAYVQIIEILRSYTNIIANEEEMIKIHDIMMTMNYNNSITCISFIKYDIIDLKHTHENKTILHRACERGFYYMVKEIIEKMYDNNDKNFD